MVGPASDAPHKPRTTVSEKQIDAAASGIRLLGGFYRPKKSSARVVGGFAPDWDIGDLEDDDETLSDDEDDNASDNELYDTDNDTGNDHTNESDNDNSNEADLSRQDNAEHGAGKEALKSTSHVISKAIPANMSTSTASMSQRQASERKLTGATSRPTKAKPDFTVSEEAISGNGCDDKKAIGQNSTSARNLKQRYNDWSRYMIWAIVILLPVLFISRFEVLERHRTLTYAKSLGNSRRRYNRPIF